MSVIRLLPGTSPYGLRVQEVVFRNKEVVVLGQGEWRRGCGFGSRGVASRVRVWVKGSGVEGACMGQGVWRRGCVYGSTCRGVEKLVTKALGFKISARGPKLGAWGLH